ncbi:MAG: Ig-like domain-containing protein [Eubacterium sp.]|nr:Ig-like domain-containing protein [Eubacterium sp.]
MCASIRPIHVYRGATTADYEVQADIGYQPTGKKYKIAYSCGGYFFVNDPDGVKYLDGESHGFVKKEDVQTIEAPTKIDGGVRAYILELNGTVKMNTTFTVTPSYASKKVTYRSLNTNIATVSSDGTITGKSYGSTKIEIKSAYGNTCAYYNVHVIEPAKSDPYGIGVKGTGIYNYSANEIRRKNLGYDYFGNSLLPEDRDGYGPVYEVGNNIGICDTRDCILESQKITSSNCYGFVVNCWRYAYRNYSVCPGQFSGKELNHDFYSLDQVVDNVLSDVKARGGEAIKLTGSDNNPNYPTDENHYLIAVRTVSEQDYKLYNETDFHFMIRKGGEWYFKCGADPGIFKILNHKTPEDVPWHIYHSNYLFGDVHDTNNSIGTKSFYSSRTQYIVIPKMPTLLDNYVTEEDELPIHLQQPYFTLDGKFMRYFLDVSEEEISGQIVSYDCAIAGIYVGTKIPTDSDFKAPDDNYVPRFETHSINVGRNNIWIKYNDGSIERIPETFLYTEENVEGVKKIRIIRD